MGDGLVQARGLRKSFGTVEAVRGVDVDVAPGEIFGFLGPNGAGKTSTMRMIGCVSPISNGTLRVMGMDPSRDGSTIRGDFGLETQFNLVHGSDGPESAAREIKLWFPNL